MREKARIKRVCNKLAKIWSQKSDLRFYQLLINHAIIPDNNYLWNIEDDKLELHLNRILKGGYK